jgi:hypothetical protein
MRMMANIGNTGTIFWPALGDHSFFADYVDNGEKSGASDANSFGDWIQAARRKNPGGEQ